MEADDVVGEDPVVDLVADLVGQHAPGVGLGPRDVDEVVQEDVGPRLADERRQRVEVVVVDHHHRLLDALDLLEDRAREVLVDDVVAELERLDLVAADVRGVGEVPQVVLDEPQHRVGEDVVEAVVGVGVGGDEADLVLAAAGRLDRERPPAVLLRDTSTSPSVIAEAIQIASRCEARPVSAVTRPPLPRRRCRRPRRSPGPRLETRTRGPPVGHRAGRQPEAPEEDAQPVAQERGIRKCARTCSLPLAAELLAQRGVAQDLERALGALLDASRPGSRTRRP